jgi:hypothetical protein
LLHLHDFFFSGWRTDQGISKKLVRRVIQEERPLILGLGRLRMTLAVNGRW